MRVKLTRELLIGSSDTMAARSGTVLEMEDEGRARELIERGLAEKSSATLTAPGEDVRGVIARDHPVMAPVHEAKGETGTVKPATKK